jgi:hypothetical protein
MLAPAQFLHRQHQLLSLAYACPSARYRLVHVHTHKCAACRLTYLLQGGIVTDPYPNGFGVDGKILVPLDTYETFNVCLPSKAVINGLVGKAGWEF